MCSCSYACISHSAFHSIQHYLSRFEIENKKARPWIGRWCGKTRTNREVYKAHKAKDTWDSGLTVNTNISTLLRLTQAKNKINRVPTSCPTAEPVEILITRLPQKIEPVGPTHHKHLKQHYFPEIFRAQAPRFYFGALHGVLISSSRLPKKDVIVIVTCPTSCSAGVMTVVE